MVKALLIHFKFLDNCGNIAGDSLYRGLIWGLIGKTI